MIPANPGNILPFHTKRRWQRNRQIGQDTIPFGIPVPRNKLIPFQLFITGNVDEDAVYWEMFSPVNDLTNITVDSTLLTRTGNLAGTGYWLTWDAGQSLDVVPDCGFWYIKLTIEGVEYYSEVMNCKNICGEDDCRLEIVADSCSEGDGVVTFSLQGSVFSAPGYEYSLQQYVLGWSEISANELYEITLTAGDEAADIQIQAITVCGLIMTRTYEITWTAGDACNTLAIADNGTSDNIANVGNNPYWRMKFTNTTDKANVLYQDGYTQWFYLLPVHDTPEIQRDVDIEVNGNGDPVRRFTRTVERKKFEFYDVPDFMLGFLAKCGDHDSVILEEVETGDDVTLTNVGFEPRRAGALLNIGIITFDAETEAFSGCQEDFELA